MQTNRVPQDGATFDYVIVGGGTAGCVLANRLSANPMTSVLMIEAGGEANSPWVSIPAGFYKLLTNPRYNWNLLSEPEAATGNRAIAMPRGKDPPRCGTMTWDARSRHATTPPSHVGPDSNSSELPCPVAAGCSMMRWNTSSGR